MKKGFSFIEVMIAIAIFGILILTFYYGLKTLLFEENVLANDSVTSLKEVDCYNNLLLTFDKDIDYIIEENRNYFYLHSIHSDKMIAFRVGEAIIINNIEYEDFIVSDAKQVGGYFLIELEYNNQKSYFYFRNRFI